MPELIFLGSEEQVQEFELDENPVDVFPCMPCLSVHREARAQLYATVCNVFFDEALAFEQLVLEPGPDGPFIYMIDDAVIADLARIEEDDVPSVVERWSDSAEMNSLGVYDTDLTDLLSTFLFNLIHFSMVAGQEEELSVYIFADG